MGYCERCEVHRPGDESIASVGAVGSVKRSGLRWAWHVHSLTEGDDRERYSVDGVLWSRKKAKSMVHSILGVANVAWDRGHEPAEYVPQRLPDDVYVEHKRSEYPLWPDRPIS